MTSPMISCVPKVYIQSQHGNKFYSTSHITATSSSQESRSGMHPLVSIYPTHLPIIHIYHTLRSNWKNVIFPLLGKRLSRDPYAFEYDRFNQEPSGQAMEAIMDSLPIKKTPSSNTIGCVKSKKLFCQLFLF